MSSFFRRLAWRIRRRRRESELEEEIAFHLDEEAEERRAEGLPAEQARWAAHRDLGSVALVQETTRDAWGWRGVEQLGQDLRYAIRTLVSDRLFTSLVVLSLALGIGANTAIYSYMDWILMRSLPVRDPGSLVVMNWRARVPRRREGGKQTKVWHSMSGSVYGDSKTGLTAGIFPFPVFDLFLESASGSLFSDVFAFSPARKLSVSVRGQAAPADGEYVTGDYFGGLGVSPAAGRLLVAADDRAGAPPVTVISFGLSQRRFGSPEAAPGQTIRINDVPFTVAGVAPPEFFGVNPAEAPDLYVPMQARLLLETDPMAPPAKKFLEPNDYWLQIMARLRPGVSISDAQTVLALRFHQWVESTASNQEERANLPALALEEGAGGLDALRRQFSRPLYVLMLLVGLILAIACANVANLLLARAAARRREIALRLSVGAGRLRVVRQLLTESLVLASLGGVLGVFVAIWGVRFLNVLLASGQQGLVTRAELNWKVLGVAAALSVFSGIVFGLAPALQATRGDVLPALKESSNPRPGSMPAGLTRVLVVSQIAMSLLLLFAAGLFVRTLSNLRSVNVGFQPENLLLFQLNARQAGHRGPEMVRLFAEVRKRIGTIGGVRSVTLSNDPLFTAGFSLDEIKIGGIDTKGTQLLFVGPEFFSTMGMAVVRGRQIEERDHLGAPQVAVVSELFATTNFGSENPLGRRLTMNDPDSRDAEIIGVVKDARYGGIKGDVPPVVYMPYDQGALKFVDEMTYAVRTAGDPLSYANAIRETVHRCDPRIPVASLITQSAQIDQSIHQEAAFAKLSSAFALLALLIACVGLYGTVAYGVVRRTGEIGIRMALGAQRSAVVFQVLREVAVTAAVGLAISAPVALGGSRYVESFLFGLKPNDPLTLLAAVGTLLTAALAAGLVPAWKASRIDPMTALRHE